MNKYNICIYSKSLELIMVMSEFKLGNKFILIINCNKETAKFISEKDMDFAECNLKQGSLFSKKFNSYEYLKKEKSKLLNLVIWNNIIEKQNSYSIKKRYNGNKISLLMKDFKCIERQIKRIDKRIASLDKNEILKSDKIMMLHLIKEKMISKYYLHLDYSKCKEQK